MRPLTRPATLPALMLVLAWVLLPATGAASAAERAGAARHTFVLVHGAWHGAWAWYRIRALLEGAGHAVFVPDLPSHGVDRATPSAVGLEDYAAAVIAAVDAAPGPVVLVGHSMGGIVVSTVAEARPQKVGRAVYLAAYLLPSGRSLFDVAVGDTDSLVTPNVVIDAGVLVFKQDGLGETFYGTSPAADVSLARSLVVPNPLQPMATPLALTDAGFGSVRRFYIRTALDRAVSPAVQDAMIAALPCERVFTLRSDHSPFFSQPRKLARVLERIAAK